MKAQIVVIAVLLSLLGCSKPEDVGTGKPAAENQAESVSHAKPEQPEQARKRNTSPNLDALFKRSREENPPRHPWGKE
jgi:hypothetical protein